MTDGKEIKIAIAPKSTKDVAIPDLLKAAFKEDSSLETWFKKLTPGKQKEYANYIAEAKRDTTKQSRLEKITPMIKNGKGLYDKYKNC